MRRSRPRLTIPDIEAILIIDPPPDSSISSASALQEFHTPVRLTSITRCHCSLSISSAGLALAIPAALTAMSRRPKRFWPAQRRRAGRQSGGHRR